MIKICCVKKFFNKKNTTEIRKSHFLSVLFVESPPQTV